MRRICCQLAMSLDGFIGAPDGNVDWIVDDPEIDMHALAARFDTWLMGRKTYEDALARGGAGMLRGMNVVVASRTLRPDDHPGVTILANDLEAKVDALRSRPGKDIWLFGGGELFRSLLDAGLVDTVEVALIPVLLGGGTPLLPPPARSAKLRLTRSRTYNPSGIVSLEYAVEP
jgi:dihydrofolate reductase